MLALGLASFLAAPIARPAARPAAQPPGGYRPPAAVPVLAAPAPTPAWLEVVRFPENPIVRPSMLPAEENENINGPTLLRVPDWVDQPLGRYYLYFAQHRGRSIHLAYADDLHGPWKIHAPGALPIAATACAQTLAEGNVHLASPEVWIDEAARQVRLYFHCPATLSGRTKQVTFVALSADGVHFTARPWMVGRSYLRVFRYAGQFYGVDGSGRLSRSPDGLQAFVGGPRLLDASVRHLGLDLDGDLLTIYYSRIGDRPERILRAEVPLADEWRTWKTAGPPVEVMRPLSPAEGEGLPLEPSRGGPARGRLNELRDPAVYREAGHLYLLYSLAGESGIGAAELRRLGARATE